MTRIVSVDECAGCQCERPTLTVALGPRAGERFCGACFAEGLHVRRTPAWWVSVISFVIAMLGLAFVFGAGLTFALSK